MTQIQKIPPPQFLRKTLINTPLGLMIGVADKAALYQLIFADQKNKISTDSIIEEETTILKQLQIELDQYFKGHFKKFTIPINPIGTAFQKKCWNTLLKIPYGQTKSYLEQAKMLNQETAYRAVANANGKNPFVVIIPCHRIINCNGRLGGYSAGINRKEWLIEHEKKHQ